MSIEYELTSPSHCSDVQPCAEASDSQRSALPHLPTSYEILMPVPISMCYAPHLREPGTIPRILRDRGEASGNRTVAPSDYHEP